MKSFHLRLHERTYGRLRAEAGRARVPATALAREAIDMWLGLKLRQARHEAVAAYTEKMTGSVFDLDPDLESAAIEHLLKMSKQPK